MSTAISFYCLSVILLISSSLSDDDYFAYSDCSIECTNYNISCTICERNAEFLNSCEDSEYRCLQKANRYSVCLRPGSEAVGGDLLWPDFRRRFHPTTTPVPSPEDIVLPWKIASIIQGILLSLISFSVFSYMTYRCKVTREGYERIQPRSPTNPYRDTILSLDDSEQEGMLDEMPQALG